MKCHSQDFGFLKTFSTSLEFSILSKENKNKILLTLVPFFPGLTNHLKCIETIFSKITEQVFFLPEKNISLPYEKRYTLKYQLIPHDKKVKQLSY